MVASFGSQPESSHQQENSILFLESGPLVLKILQNNLYLLTKYALFFSVVVLFFLPEKGTYTLTNQNCIA